MTDTLIARIAVAIRELDKCNTSTIKIVDGPIIWYSSIDSKKNKHYVFFYDCSICGKPHCEYVSFNNRMGTRHQLQTENPVQWNRIKVLKCAMC